MFQFVVSIWWQPDQPAPVREVFPMAELGSAIARRQQVNRYDPLGLGRPTRATLGMEPVAPAPPPPEPR